MNRIFKFFNDLYWEIRISIKLLIEYPKIKRQAALDIQKRNLIRHANELIQEDERERIR